MRYSVRVGIVVGLLGLATLSAQRQQVWGDELRLWRTAVSHSPAKPRPWINLGQQYARLGYDEMAIDAFALASALSQRPGRAPDEQVLGWAIAETNLAVVDLNRGALVPAQGRLQAVVTRAPHFKTPGRMLTWVGQRLTSSPLPPASF